MKKKLTNYSLLQNFAVALFFAFAFLLNSSSIKAQSNFPLFPVPLCTVNNTTFTPQIGVGSNIKMMIGGYSWNDGSICWNCYNDSNYMGRSRAFNMPTGLSYSGFTPQFSARITQDVSNNVLKFQTGTSQCYDSITWNDGLAILSNGNVGIGTNQTFNYKLAVNGGIACKNDMMITLTGLSWPDYVFSSSYQLKPLLLLEREIDSLGYLPEMPSAQEIETNGLSVSKVTSTVVKKVEELTLYTIDQQKQLDELKKQNEELKALLKSLLKEKE